jgi:hypothetical protein
MRVAVHPYSALPVPAPRVRNRPRNDQRPGTVFTEPGLWPVVLRVGVAGFEPTTSSSRTSSRWVTWGQRRCQADDLRRSKAAEASGVAVLPCCTRQRRSDAPNGWPGRRARRARRASAARSPERGRPGRAPVGVARAARRAQRPSRDDRSDAGEDLFAQSGLSWSPPSVGQALPYPGFSRAGKPASVTDPGLTWPQRSVTTIVRCAVMCARGSHRSSRAGLRAREVPG